MIYLDTSVALIALLGQSGADEATRLIMEIKDSKKYPLLSAEQEAELADEVKQRDRKSVV